MDYNKDRKKTSDGKFLSKRVKIRDIKINALQKKFEKLRKDLKKN
tara:strand:+ start:375 stop:509 length:135 start_codon:yes stop_codon:yes gene_type:complete